MRKFIFILLAGSCLLSCIPDTTPDDSKDPLMGTDKMINSRQAGASNHLFVKSYTASDDGFKKAVPQGTIVNKVFPSTPGKQELEARFGLDRWYEIVPPDGADPERVAESLVSERSVQFVQYDRFYTRASDCKVYPVSPDTRATVSGSDSDLFNDPHFSAQWNYVNVGNTAISKNAYRGADINVADVWRKLTCGDNSIIVAVIDEAVKYTHPDLVANMWTDPKDGTHGLNFVTNGPLTWDQEDDSGHGTHCAGVIAAVNNNRTGVCGVAGGSGAGDGVKIMSCQIFSGNKVASAKQTANAFKYAADHGASIASCSFGFKGGVYTSDNDYLNGNYGSNAMEADAIHYFEATRNNDVLDGGLVIFASGNDALNFAEYPGALHDLIAVSAYGPDFLPAYYTNYGPGCNIVAPGGEYYHYNAKGEVRPDSMILSTVTSERNDGADYGYMQGTSMACPHVTGIAALGLSYAKSLGKHFTVQEFKNLLLASANDFDSRLKGTKVLYNTTLELRKYVKLMGTGAIDTWNFMMKIEGIPSVTVETGSEQWINVSNWFGTASVNLTYLGEQEEDKVYVEISDEDMAELGMPEKPYMRFGKLFIYPTKPGACKLTIRAVAGGTIVGGGDNVGGMEVSQTLSVIARDFKSANGGWL